jgi:DNA polymerase I-like protein with 3'-5' exonuclease and polymerase domains
MEAASLAARIGQPEIVARDLLRAYRETYRISKRWSDAAVDHALVHGSLHTVYGWRLHIGESPNPRSLRNFPAQANGAEMLRLACCLATERGIEICAPVHDAVLICAPLDRLEEDIANTRAAMAEASRHVLSGFELRTDVQRICYPDRFSDPRGDRMWRKVTELIAKRTGAAAAPPKVA